MNVFHKFAIKSLKLNRTRTIVTIIGIILSTAMLTAVTTTVRAVCSNFYWKLRRNRMAAGMVLCRIFQ